MALSTFLVTLNCMCGESSTCTVVLADGGSAPIICPSCGRYMKLSSIPPPELELAVTALGDDDGPFAAVLIDPDPEK